MSTDPPGTDQSTRRQDLSPSNVSQARLKQLIEQRVEPRFKTHFPAEILSEDGGIASATITNLSLSGLQLTGNHQLLQKLAPNIYRQNHHIPLNFSVHFKVPTSTQLSEAIDISCTLTYTRRIEFDLYLLGCNFSVFNHHCDNTLKDYIEHFGIPS